MVPLRRVKREITCQQNSWSKLLTCDSLKQATFQGPDFDFFVGNKGDLAPDDTQFLIYTSVRKYR